MSYTSGGPSRTSTPEHRARRRRVFARDGHRCKIRGPQCTGAADVLDHIVPIAEGGDETDENCQTACNPCHDAKSRAEAARGRRRQARNARHPSEPHPGLKRSTQGGNPSRRPARPPVA
ncbi:HNH endonuclease [Tsukamurella asaccharolytica]|uniref:HNH endonuclease n=1 Tax=Tsukamurella asaccharolytica TaxID=2592067 RepID=UPI001960E9E5